MRRRRWLAFLLAAAVMLSLLAGCEGKTELEEGERERVTIALWSDQLTEYYGQYLTEAFPEVDFEFYSATNSADFYRFKEKTGDLPDIMTVRRFALNDVASWRESLMDLSDSELANTFHQFYLHNYTYSDGTVNWLPACAEIDSIIINRPLLEENNIPLPTSYQEFVDACAALQELGIRPFLSNFGEDYTCMEILQGLSIEQLVSQEGREWRQQYESGQTDQLSEAVWLPVFQRMEEFIGYTGITEADIALHHTELLDAFKRGELAMMRGTGNEEAVRSSTNGAFQLMPYFGESPDDNWYLTYPAFQIAASARAAESPERKQLILDIMAAMLSEDGQQRIASGKNMIPYNKDVELELSPELANLQPSIDNNRLYIRLASSDMFSVSLQVVQGMIRGDYPDARAAFDAFNKAMNQGGEAAPAAAHINTGYSFAFRPEGGNQAASAVMNTLREEVGVPLLIGWTVNVSGDVMAGDYTLDELRFLTQGDSLKLLRCEMTGSQLYDYMEYVLTTPGKRGSVVNDATLYVSSGFEMTIQKTDAGYVLEKLTVDGQELDREETYDLAILGSGMPLQTEALAAAGVKEYDTLDRVYKQIIVDRLAGGEQLAEPTDYITLR